MKILTITKSAEFQIISKKGKKFHAKSLLLLSLPSPEFYFQNKEKGKNAVDFVRFGYTASKLIGNAVIRNQAKRRLREAVRELAPLYAKNQHDYVVIAKKEISQATYDTILLDLKFCLKRIHAPKI